MPPLEDSLARITAWLEAVKGFEEITEHSGGNSIELSLKLSRAFLGLRMCPVYYPSIMGEHSAQSSIRWSNSGIASRGGYSTFSFSESPSDVADSSFQDVLETQVHPKYYLSPTACAGILRRAEKRGKPIPPKLKLILEYIANPTNSELSD
jgi:hypothetical protein